MGLSRSVPQCWGGWMSTGGLVPTKAIGLERPSWYVAVLSWGTGNAVRVQTLLLSSECSHSHSQSLRSGGFWDLHNGVSPMDDGYGGFSWKGQRSGMTYVAILMVSLLYRKLKIFHHDTAAHPSLIYNFPEMRLFRQSDAFIQQMNMDRVGSSIFCNLPVLAGYFPHHP